MPTAFFDKELSRLRESLAMMGGAVERMLDDALTALRTGDRELADRTIAFDKKINEMDNRITSKTILLIATNQPVAGDLRFLAAALRMTGELERVGDLSANLSRRAKALAEAAPQAGLPDDLEELAVLARNMLGGALNSFADHDTNRAKAVLDMDDQADDMNRRVRSRMVEEIAADGSRIHQGLEIINTAAHLERLADHATNLAEDIIYIYSGYNVRHCESTGASAASTEAALAVGCHQNREDMED